MKLLVSACLLGVACRYDGCAKPIPNIQRLARRYDLIPVCPEIFGGLPTPRPPCELVGGSVLTRKGADMTAAYEKGASETLKLARLLGCHAALLKDRSPSCGSGKIYDGSFSGTLKDGYGITAELLHRENIRIYNEREIEELLKKEEKLVD